MPAASTKFLRHEEHALEHLWVLDVQKVAADNELNQLIHKAIKLFRVPLGAVVDHGGEGGQAGGDKMWHTLTLLVCQVADHHGEQVIRLHIQAQQLCNLV